MNRTQIVALANAVAAIRPDWQQAGIVKQLEVLANGWAGSDGALSAHVMSIAAHPQSQTPGAFNHAPPDTPAYTPRQQPGWREPMCNICSRTRTACIRQRDWELRHGVPDPHEFETADDYQRRTRHATDR